MKVKKFVNVGVCFLGCVALNSCFSVIASSNEPMYTITSKGEAYKKGIFSKSFSASIEDIYVSGMDDAGFDINIKLSSSANITRMRLFFWKDGNYQDRKDVTINSVERNTFKQRILFKDIGAGTEYVYFGIHPYDPNTNTPVFICDTAVKLDLVAPVINSATLSTNNWTNSNLNLSVTAKDNNNIVEHIRLIDSSDNIISKKETFSKPKILHVQTADKSKIKEVLRSYNYDHITVPSTSITNVDQLKGYDIVILDSCYWAISPEMAIIAMSAFDSGTSIITIGNDDFSPIGVSYLGYLSSSTYRFQEYMNNGSSPPKGRTTRFAHYLNSFSETEHHHKIGLGADFFKISDAINSDGTKTSGILSKTNPNGAKWIHFQGTGAGPANTYRRAFDEIMYGTMKSRQTYNEDFTISENGEYTLEVIDFDGNINSQTINVSNIDKQKPIITASFDSSEFSKEVEVSLSATDDLSGIKSITLPNGDVINSTTTSFIADKNESVLVKAEDNAGNIREQMITISNIDKEPPTAVNNINYSTSDFSATVTINADDVGSGFDYLIHNDKKVTHLPYTFDFDPVNRNRIHLFDKAGNSRKHDILLDNLTLEQIELAIDSLNRYPDRSYIDIAFVRSMTNSIEDEALKNSLEQRLNDVLHSERVPPKSYSGQADIYITPLHSLSLSLDTNSIYFDDVDWVDDIEKKNAINLTVSSTAPYEINASISSPISNNDSSITIPNNVLSIKSNDISNYSTFGAVDEKVHILDNNFTTGDVVHGIDIKLSSSNIYKTDIYKTSIKFEINQK